MICIVTQIEVRKEDCAAFPERMPLLIFIGFIPNSIREPFSAVREAEKFPRKRKI